MRMKKCLYGEDAEKAMAAGQAALMCDDPVRVAAAVRQIFGDLQGVATSIGDHVLVDADLNKWAEHKSGVMTVTGKYLLNETLQRPQGSATIGVILKRQDMIREVASDAGRRGRLEELLREARIFERDGLWVIKRPDLQNTWPLPLLFPSLLGVRSLNKVSGFHEFYHIYRLLLSPGATVLYPLMMLLGPWWYLRTKLKWPITLQAYFGFLWKGLQSIGKGSEGGGGQMTLTIGVYTAMYAYTAMQAIDIARRVYNARQILSERLRRVHRLIGIASELVQLGDLEETWWPSVKAKGKGPSGLLSHRFKGVWQWWHSPSVAWDIEWAFRQIAAADVLAVAVRHSTMTGWSVVNLGCTETEGAKPRFWSMGHPCLDGCVVNPACLKRMMIVTGPNAGGKTTYIRSILANVLLSQTLGIACAGRAQLLPFDQIHSFMRICDETGKESLFEAEVARCTSMWRAANKVCGDGRVFMVLDEPMHSTPPREGAAAAMAFLMGLARMGHVTAVVTTHYADMVRLAHDDPTAFVNVSMEAKVAPNGDSIHFPYILRSGSSFQSIALELMRIRGMFPDAFIDDALKLKEKIGHNEVVSKI
jgi:hypothetical protein